MSSTVIDGKSLAIQVRDKVKDEVNILESKYSIAPNLNVIQVGTDPPSLVYVRNKQIAAQKAGMCAKDIHLPEKISQKELISKIMELNIDPGVHGILVQLPLPYHIDTGKIIDAIDPNKDVDGVHPINIGRLSQGRQLFVPATPAGVQRMLLESGINPTGQHVVICGRSNIVGKPLALLLSQQNHGANSTVTVCHSKTRDIANFTRQADILVAAIGKPLFINSGMVKEGAVIIDVGINRIDDHKRKNGYRLVGDVDFDSVLGKVSSISPVPGGVGPMTIAMLLENTLLATRLAVGDLTIEY